MAIKDLDALARNPGSPYRAMMPVFPVRLRELETTTRDIVELRPAQSAPVEPDTAVIPILELSGFHGYLDPFPRDGQDSLVGGAARISTAIFQECERSPEALVLSGGDFFQGPPISTQFDGKPVIEVMNVDGYDTLTLGNHDFDRGIDLLSARLREGHFTPLAANLREAGTKRPVWESGHALNMVRPYRVMQSGDRRVAVVGLMKPETPELTGKDNCKGLEFAPISETLADVLPDLVGKERPDVVVLHCQQIHQSRDILRTARRIAEESSNGQPAPLIVFLGGHGHPDFAKPVVTDDGVIVQSTDRGEALNVTRLHVDRKTRQLISIDHQYRTIREKDIKPDPDVENILCKYHARLDHQMSRVVGNATVDLKRSRHTDSGMGIMVTEMMKEAGQAEVAIVTGGSLKSDLLRGPITVGKVHESIPFDNRLVVLGMSGRQLQQVLEKSAMRPTGDKVLQMAGMRMTYDSSKPRGQRVLESSVNGRPIEPDRTYRVAVDSFLADGGDFFTEFVGCPRLSEGGRVKDLLAQWLERQGTVSVQPDGRIRDAAKQ